MEPSAGRIRAEYKKRGFWVDDLTDEQLVFVFESTLQGRAMALSMAFGDLFKSLRFRGRFGR